MRLMTSSTCASRAGVARLQLAASSHLATSESQKMCRTGSMPGFQFRRKASIRPVSWQMRYICGSVCSRFIRRCGVQNGSLMLTAFQGTAVHAGPGCFIDVGKEDLWLDEGDTISTTLCISHPPALRPDAESYLGEERIASSQAYSYSFRPPARPSTICFWKKRNTITAGNPPRSAEAMIWA